MKKILSSILAIIGLILLTSHFLVSPPPASIDPFLNGVFKEGVTNEGKSWKLSDPFPDIDIPSPVRIIEYNSEKLMVLSKLGYVYLLDKKQNTLKTVLDLNNRTFHLSDAGALGIALHPEFGNPDIEGKDLIFIYYRTTMNPEEYDERGFNILSKFTWDPESEEFSSDSEEILISQYDRMPWHDGGSMFFGEDGFLYFAIGDEGKSEFQEVSTQRLDGGLFSGVFRIDVNMDNSKSHPIRRQPLSNVDPPPGFGETYSQGYFIPNDNPWTDEDGSILEEYFALGVRSPYTMQYDEINGSFWLCDVGSDKREEINNFYKGDNMQWPYMEGTTVNADFPKPDSIIGNERSIVYEYDRSVGNAIIGAGVYYKDLYPDLYGKYIFGDYARNKFFILEKDTEGNVYAENILTGIDHTSFGFPDPVNISSINIQDDGKIFVTVLNIETKEIGKILELTTGQTSLSVPEKLSDVGVFKDLKSLEIVDGLIPYDVASPLWSDRAQKKRWVAVPHEGDFDMPEEKIDFNALDNYNFPLGTVFVKHFSLPTNLSDGSQSIPLETRFFIIGKTGSFGVTYAWNEEGTEAYHLPEGGSRFIDIYDGSEVAYTQKWDYPSWSQCLDCHTKVANEVLGFRTHQLNKDFYYPKEGVTMNQLDFFSKNKVFKGMMSAPATYPRAYPMGDSSVPLEIRLRSYLDGNCSSCHRNGNLQETNLDFRFSATHDLREWLTVPTESHASAPGGQVVTPGHPELSELWIRDNSVNNNKMPPVGRNLVDKVYIDSLTKWIGSLKDEVVKEKINLLFPNPANEWLSLKINENWTLPVKVELYDMQGRKVSAKDVFLRFTNIDITNVVQGAYLLKLEDIKGNKEIIRVIKR